MVEKLVFQNACALGWETNNHSYTCFSGRTKKCFKLIIKFHRYFILFCSCYDILEIMFTHKLLPYHATVFKHHKTLTCISCLFAKIDNFTNIIYSRNAAIWIFNI